MILRFADWKALQHEALARRWREHPYLMLIVALVFASASAYVNMQTREKLRNQIDQIDASLRRIQRSMGLKVEPTERERRVQQSRSQMYRAGR